MACEKTARWGGRNMENEKKIVRRFVFKLFKVYWKRELLAAVLVGVMIALAVVFPLLIRLLIDVVIPSDNMDLLVKYVLLVVGSGLEA
jgi:ABC-type bacteriocin/lantibiotic exporter with double-glycine peptidase domain